MDLPQDSRTATFRNKALFCHAVPTRPQLPAVAQQEGEAHQRSKINRPLSALYSPARVIMDVEHPKRLAGAAAAALTALPASLILTPPPVLTLHGPILATLVPDGQNTILAGSVHVRLAA
ncbi:hypothetical protein S40293_10973 [Stachybotrys chartarum IBT 40293]|jgi:hypothetical protein|nr:hypothetical protein S40293_10973 [Stachybotrys chartarum IBT 40293]